MVKLQTKLRTLGLFLMGTTLHLSVNAQLPCENGFAGVFPCDKVDLKSRMTIDEIGGGENLNDIWGWTSDSGKEIAIVGRSNGTSFVDMTDPLNPIYLGDLPTQTMPSLWRDMKVFGHYAFIVSEAFGHGMQVFDLNQLENVTNPPVIFEPDAHYNLFGNSHNIAINEATGYAYAVGTGTFSGGLHIIDINDPLNPELAGGYELSGYTHDAQIVIYNGPDADHQGSEVAFCCNGGSFVIVDVTDKADCTWISGGVYPNLVYTHQGWLTEDQKYFLLNDEIDEGTFGFNTRTHLWDVQDLDFPVYMGYYEAPVLSTDHNLYIKGNYAYMSNYLSGLRIVDISNVANGELSEVAYFDVVPDINVPGYNGSWSNYPYFESGVIPVTCIECGLFIVEPDMNQIVSVPSIDSDELQAAFTVFPVPAEDELHLNWQNAGLLQGIDILDISGKLIKRVPVTGINGAFVTPVSDLAPGIYIARLNAAEPVTIRFTKN